MYQILEDLRLRLLPENTFMGRCEKGFDFLGYHITLEGLTPNPQAQERALDKALRRYAQGGLGSLQRYLKHWRNWAHGGLCGRVRGVSEILINRTPRLRDRLWFETIAKVSSSPTKLVKSL